MPHIGEIEEQLPRTRKRTEPASAAKAFVWQSSYGIAEAMP
jgi:hypothetical protein